MRPLVLLALAALAGCSVNVEGAACRNPGEAADCPSGQACGNDHTCSAAAASCPAAGSAVGQGCGSAGATACAGDVLVQCAPAVGAPCDVWGAQEDCAASGLRCEPAGGAACACPAIASSPAVRYADSGAPRRAGLVPNGAQVPACRYGSLAAALAASSSGDTVEATGFAGTPVVFTEDPLTVPAGVTLTTSDAPLTTTSYVLEPSAAVAASALVTLRPGATLSGFELRNAAATGVGVATGCAGAADTATVTVDTVKVTGLGGGATPARFANGLRHTGNCSLVVSSSTFTGADDGGVVVSDAAASTSLTMTGNVIQQNQANVTRYTIGPGPDRHGGGLVFVGTLPGSVAFNANRLLSNDGDQILVFSAGALDLSRAACDASANTIACYGTGAGISSKAGTVNVGHTTWGSAIPTAGVDYVTEAGAILTGTTQPCARYPGTCP